MTQQPVERSKLEVMANVATIVATVMAMFGIIFAIQQYLATKADERISETLNYVSRFNSDPIHSSLLILFKSYKKSPRTLNVGDPTKAEVNFIQSNDLEWQAVLLGDFFDQLYTCVSAGLCNQALATRMLSRDIEAVYVLTGRYLKVKRRPTGCGLTALFKVMHPLLKYSRMSAAKKRETNPPSVELAQNACPAI